MVLGSVRFLPWRMKSQLALFKDNSAYEARLKELREMLDKAIEEGKPIRKILDEIKIYQLLKK